MTPIEKKAVKKTAELLNFYKIGVEAKEATGNFGKHEEERIAAKYGLSTSSVAQARSFAKLIGEDELDEICKRRNRKGQAFGRGLATLLAPLKKRKHRDQVLGQWEKKCLSASDMKALITTKVGKSVRVGRRSKQPKSSSEAIVQLRDRCITWIKWYGELANVDAGEISLGDLPPSVRKQLQKTIAEVEKLHNMTTKVD